jgi:predicted metal-dependent HD superfamily phosphohydrolase
MSEKPIVRYDALDPAEVSLLLQRWQEPHRRWHGLRHLADLQHRIYSDPGLSESDREMLGYVALFHDIVYAPLRSDNEAESAKVAERYLAQYPRRDEVVAAILATVTHEARTPLEQKFNAWDCAILSDTNWRNLLAYETAIAFEYREVDPATYRCERGKFLRAAAIKHHNPKLARLAEEVENGRTTD